jgi:hypothetical protein
MVLVRRTVTEKVFTPKYGGRNRTRTFWAEGLVIEDDGTTLVVKLEAGTACTNPVIRVPKMGDEWKLRYP